MGFPMTVDRVIARNGITNENAQDDIRRLAADSVTLYKTGLAEAVRALGLKWESDADVIEMADTSTKARRALSAEVLRLCAAELLALLEDKAEPSGVTE